MSSLQRMLLADLLRMWRQGLAIVVLLACGVATFIMSTSTMRSLESSRDRYYRDYRFADLFVSLVRAPNTLLDRILAISGVGSASGRIVREVLLDMPTRIEPVSCRLVSLEDDPVRAINGIYVRRGRLPMVSDRTEVLVSELFAEAHGLKPGDMLKANLGGTLEVLHVVGIGLSPEYIYVVQPGLLLSDDARYGVLWTPYANMASAYNMEGAFNHLTLLLERGASEQAILRQLDSLTKPFGGTGAYGREDQESHSRVADEMREMRTMATLSPTIFLSVTLFLLHIVFSRLVHQQRETIATLRAFGYYPSEIGWHYVRLVLVWVVLGTSIGILAGVRASWWMGSLYMMFFRFPAMQYPLLTWEWLAAVLLALTVAVLGSIGSIRSAMRLPPAVSMRPEVSARFRTSMLEQRGLRWLSSPIALLVVRRLESNPWIAALSILGLALGMSIVILSSFFEDTIDFVLENQFVRSQRQDLMLTFNEPCSESALHDVRQMDGILDVEAFRAVPVRIHHGVVSERVSLMGLNSTPALYRVLDDRERSLEFFERGGLVLTEKLAQMLGVQLGDEVEIEWLEGQDRTVRLDVASIFPNFTGPAAFMLRSDLHSLLMEGERVSGVFATIDRSKLDRIYSQIKQTPAIVGVLDKQAALSHFRDMISKSTYWMRTINAVFAALIAIGVTYNAALITYTERARDLATLRVMGFSKRELSKVLLAEMAFITVMAIPIGIPISYAFCYLTTLAIDTKNHRFPLVIDRDTIAYGITVLLLAVAASSVAVLRLLNRLDMLSVLKVRE